MRSNLKLVTAPAEIPISVADIKTYLRIDNNVEDIMLDIMIKSVVFKLENYLSVKFITQVWDVYFDSFGKRSQNEFIDGIHDMAISELAGRSRIELPIGPVISLDQFNTYADDDIAVVQSVSQYTVDKISMQGRISLKIGGIWPTTILRGSNGVQFRVTVGFGDKTKVPFDIVQAITEYVAYLYENRGDKEANEIPPHVLQLIDSYRVYKSA